MNNMTFKVSRRKNLVRVIVGIFLGYQVSFVLYGSARLLICKKNIRDISNIFEFFKFKEQNIEDNHGIIYIGLLSAEKFLDTRLKSNFNTWIRHLPSSVRVDVFAENRRSIDVEDGVNFVELPGVKDQMYPPQKKSFSMLKYMFDWYIDKYDWFVRLDDDTYLDSQRLLRLLTGINASKPVYMGHVGLGFHAEDYLGENDSFCMGGTGMIFSRGLLKLLAPKLKYCLGNLYTNHEDVELGRCIQRTTKIKCVTAWEAAEIFFQDYESKTGSIETFSKINFETGVTFHPNKDQGQKIKFHVRLLKEKIKRWISKIADLEKEIRSYNVHQNHLVESGANIVWETELGRSVYRAKEQPKSRLHPSFEKVLFEYENAFKKGRTISSINRKLNYRSINPLLSSDTILLMQVSYVYGSNKILNHYLLHRQYFPSSLVFMHENHDIKLHRSGINLLKSQSFEKGDLTNHPDVAVNFIVILSGRIGHFFRFLSNFENVFLQNRENVNLIVVYFSVTNDFRQPIELQEENMNEFFSAMQNLQQRYSDHLIKAVDLTNVTYCKTIGLQIAKDQVKNENEILYFCDVDMLFDSPYFLHQVRYNTIQGKQAYYPVTFSQYDPDIVYRSSKKPSMVFEIKETDGFWRYYGFGMFSIFRGDFNQTQGFDTKICGWGQEDIEMANSVIKADFNIFQSPNPFQIHVFHKKVCDKTLSELRYKACIAVRMLHYGPKTFLFQIYKQRKLNDLAQVYYYY